MKKVRCIDDNGMSNLENGQIYEVELVYNDLGGEPLYRLKGVSGSKYASRFEEVIEPKFKVGDFVKGIGNRYGVTNSHMTKGVVRYVGGEDEIGVQILERDGEPISDDIVFDVSEEYFELWEEPKPKAKERATVKKVRCINANGLTSFKQGEICEVLSEEGNTYQLKGGVGSYTKYRFEDVIEPDFKIGDTVKVIKEDVEFDRPHVGKVAKIGEITPTGSYYLEGIGIHMYAEQLELVSERRFKVGDVVKIKDIPPARRWNFDGQMDYLKGKSEKIIGFGARSNEYLVMATTRWRDYWVIEDDDIECLAPEPKAKPTVKERATVKKVRCIDATLSSNKLKTNTIYEVENSYTSNFGTPFYNLKGFGDFNFMQNRFEDVIEEKYPQIEYLADGTKVVFNPPYTIVERNGLVGKVKCYHKDEYTKWGGYTEALKVMKPCSK